MGGTASDIKISADEILRLRKDVINILAKHSGKPADDVEKDIDRDRYLSAEEAIEYGLIDEIIAHQSALPTQANRDKDS